MNRLMIIGNLTKDPELRTTPAGKQVCNFSVAVNRRQKDQNGQTITDFFRVSAWNELANNCAKYLTKGKKIAVIGTVSVRTYESNGKSGASLEVMASEVEFLSPKEDAAQKSEQMIQQADRAMTGQQLNLTEVQMSDDDLPF